MAKKESGNEKTEGGYLDKDDKEGFIALLIMGWFFCVLGLAYRVIKMLGGEIPGYHHKKAFILFTVGFCLFSFLIFVVFKKKKGIQKI